MCNDFLLVKALKIALLSRRNANFQDIEVPTKRQNRRKIDEKLFVFRDIDFELILGGFGEGFGRAKSLIFLFFSYFFDAKLSMQLECKQKLEKRGGSPNRAECAGPGGRIIGWGEAYLSLNFKPYL